MAWKTHKNISGKMDNLSERTVPEHVCCDTCAYCYHGKRLVCWVTGKATKENSFCHRWEDMNDEEGQGVERDIAWHPRCGG